MYTLFSHLLSLPARDLERFRKSRNNAAFLRVSRMLLDEVAEKKRRNWTRTERAEVESNMHSKDSFFPMIEQEYDK